MQLGNFIDVFLARHVSGTYAHHQVQVARHHPHRTHELRSGSQDSTATSAPYTRTTQRLSRQHSNIRTVHTNYAAALKTAQQHPHRTHELRSGSQVHHPSTNSVQKTTCCSSTCNAPDDGRMYPKHVELRIHQ